MNRLPRSSLVQFLSFAVLAVAAGCSSDTGTLLMHSRFDGHISSVLLTVAEPDMIPEGITYDPDTGRVFLGSFRRSKIVVVDADGNASDFIDEREYGFGAGLGMRVDTSKRQLWACTSSAPHQRDFDPQVPGETGLFVFDVDSGELLWKFVRPQEGPLDVFNDVVLTPEGDAFVSGFFSRKIFRADSERQTVEMFLELPEGHRPNGLDLSDDGRFLFVASNGNIVVVDPITAEWYELEVPDGENFVGIDGLYFYDHSLIAIQGKRGYGEEGTRVARLFLAKGYDRVERIEVLDDDHPLYEQPTTGVLDEHALYYIANSQFTKFDENFKLAPKRELSDVVVLRLDIPR